MNHASLSTYWTVGAYVSLRTKSGSWGDRTVDALCDYLKTRHPKLRGFSRRQIYNMIAFYDTYSSIEFKNIFDRLRLYEFVQSATAQFEVLISCHNFISNHTLRKDTGTGACSIKYS